ncbi:MAG TPA: hypothetical protein VJ770_23815 [Stellaceae bacterium]|nr:hypothetical protein [Stellaceae bacterium]
MRLGFETIGNATLVFYENGRAVLATDPWLKGTCYFGSWALDRPLTARETAAVIAADYIWISHGHPDHLHPESLALLPRGKKILLPDHYTCEIRDSLQGLGFDVTVLRYRQWQQLSPHLRCLCLDNENQDAILIVEAGASLIVNLNDSPLCGEERFLRTLIRRYDRRNTYLARLCAIDADMLNFVDSEGRRLTEPPERHKPGMVWATARLAARLGIGNFVCSSSQHLYVRPDSKWANPYRILWEDIERHWSRPQIRVLEPFVVVDVETGRYERKHPTQQSDESRISDSTGDDDYSEPLSATDWSRIVAFFGRFALLRSRFDYLEFVVGGERHRLWLAAGRAGRRGRPWRGLAFHVPRAALMAAVECGYFDDLLIGNFMKTELHNAKLYPHFTPVVAKLGGNAKVFTRAELRAFKWRYFRRNPGGYILWHLEQRRERWIDGARLLADYFGVKGPLKLLYRKILADPVR